MAKTLIRFDWALKRLLRQKANFGVLEGFLTELLKFDVLINHIAESEANQEDERDKFNRVDIFAQTSENELIIIELQIDNQVDYFHRMLYGVSKTITQHINLGDEYSQVKKIYSVNIVYFQLGQGTDYVYHGKTEFIGLHNKDVLQLSSSQKSKYFIEHVHNIFPEYYVLKINQFNDIAKDGLDEWIYFFKNDEIKDSFKARGIQEAKEKLKTDSMTEEERRTYIRHIENIVLGESVVETARIEGEMKGKIEEKKAIAKNMLEKGFPTAVISEVTGLSEDEIENLY